MSYRQLDAFEMQSLQAFAKAHGRRWKSELSDVYWYNARIWEGPVPGMGTALHGIRNEFGPTWLYDEFKLPKEPVLVDMDAEVSPGPGPAPGL